MYYNPTTETKYTLHSEIRSSFKGISLPAVLTDTFLLSLGVYRLELVEPVYDAITQGVTEGEPVLDGDLYIQTWIVHSLDPEQIEANIEAAKARLIEAATSKRWDIMTGGMTLPGGIRVGTDIDDQNRITSVVANANLAGLTDADEVDFKAVSGWVRITIAEVKAIAGAIGQFVQACYSAERAHHEAIELLETPAEINAYDLDSGWPQTEPETAET